MLPCYLGNRNSAALGQYGHLFNRGALIELVHEFFAPGSFGVGHVSSKIVDARNWFWCCNSSHSSIRI
jgi:hypothetical protein